MKMALSALYFVLVLLGVKLVACDIFFHDANVHEGSVCTLSNGGNGRCTPNCTDMRYRNRQNICGFEGSKVLICCPESVYSSTISYPTLQEVCLYRKRHYKEKTRESMEIDVRFVDVEMIDGYMPRSNAPSATGISSEPEPVGSKLPASLMRHSHIAALGLRNKFNTTIWFCGGTLIHPSYVLTAASCLFERGIEPNIVRILDSDVTSNDDDDFAVNYDVRAFFIHDHFHLSKFYNDIALLEITKNAEFRNKPEPLPACLWTKPDIPRATLSAMGFATDAFGIEYFGRLYGTNLTVCESRVCVEASRAVSAIPYEIAEGQICAYDKEGLLNTCGSDAGGPLLFTDTDSLETPYIVGVASMGVLCVSGSPDVHTRLYPYLEWIETIISSKK